MERGQWTKQEETMRKVIQERPINLLAGAVALAVSCMPVLAQQKNPDRNAYFGEQHVHTSWATTSGSSSRST